MADYTKSITASINLFGGSPSTKWLCFNWGQAKWGEGTELIPKQVSKGISNTQESTSIVNFQVIKYVVTDLPINSPIAFIRQIYICNSTTISFYKDEIKSQGEWDYEFVKPTIYGESRNLGTFSLTTLGGSGAWTQVVFTRPTWS